MQRKVIISNTNGNLLSLQTAAGVQPYSLTFPANVNPSLTTASLLFGTGSGNLGWTDATGVANGWVLTMNSSGGDLVPSWVDPLTLNFWQLGGNAATTAYNGTTGNFIGTSNNQPLVIATTNTITAEPIEFFTNNVETMRLSGSGELGIGTTNPSQLLQVNNGNILLSNSGSADQLQFQGTGSGITTFQAGAQGATNINYTLPTNPASISGQVLSATTAGVLSWQSVGSVTSVSLSLPGSLFSVSGSPITLSGTLAGSLLTQPANTVFAGPSSGGAVSPTFRALVAADIPPLNYVTSVSLSLPPIFTISGSPVTSSGTLTGSLANQSANTFFAGPSSGVPAAPTFRTLTPTDIPALSYVTSVGLSLPSIFSVSGSPVTSSGTLTGTLATQTAATVFAGPISGGAATPTFRTLTPTDIPALSYVTSVGLSLPSIFTVSGSPVTSSGTLTGTLATQSANVVFAGPSSGGAATPTFRALAASDIPVLTGYILNQTTLQASSNFNISDTGYASSFAGHDGSSGSSLIVRAGNGSLILAGNLNLKGGNAGTASAIAGGAVNINGGTGSSSGTSTGGAINITGGLGGSAAGTGGAISITGGSGTGGGDVTITGGDQTTLGVGGTLRLRAGNSFGSNVGNPAYLTGGIAGTIGTGGFAQIQGGTGGTTSGNGGGANIFGGNSTSGVGGAIVLTAGTSGGTANGGAITLTTTNGSSTGNGGAFSVTTGNGAGTGNGGAISMTAGNSGTSAGAASGTVTLTGGSANVAATPGGGVILSGGNGNTTGAAGGVALNGGVAGATGVGGAIVLTASNGGSTSGTGGAINLSSGSGTGTTFAGGNINIQAGNGAPNTSNGGTINVTAGNGGANSGNGGAINLTAGNAPSSGSGGAANISAGNGVGTNQSGGGVTISGGNASGTGSSTLLFQTAKAGLTGVTTNNAVTHMTLDGIGNLTLNASTAYLALTGTTTGITTFQAGAQGASNIGYVLPTSAPVANSILYSSGGSNSNLSWTGSGVANQVLTISGGVPSWQNISAIPLAWYNTGNTGLTDGVSNFLGTLDNTPIRFVTGLLGPNTRMVLDISGNLLLGAGSGSTATFSAGSGHLALGDNLTTTHINGITAKPLDIIDANGGIRLWSFASQSAGSANPTLEFIGGTNDNQGNAANTWWDMYTTGTPYSTNTGSHSSGEHMAIRRRTGTVDSEYVSVFANGNVGIGEDGTNSGGVANAATRLTVSNNDAVTTTTTNILALQHNSTGTPSTNFGTGLDFLGKSSTTLNRDMGSIQTIWTNATDASRTSAMTFSTDTSTSSSPTEKVRIAGNGYVGINATDPGVRMDINGGYATRSKSVTLTNGVNNNVAVGDCAYLRIIGPTAPFTITGLAAGIDGQRLRIVNISGKDMTIANLSGSSSAGNLIETDVGSDITVKGTVPILDMTYDIGLGEWLLGTLNANQVIGGVGSIIYSVKASDQNATNNSVLANDNDLSFSVNANQTWEVNGELNASNGNNGIDIKMGFNLPAGSNAQIDYTGIASAGGNAIQGNDQFVASNAAATQALTCGIVAGKPSLIFVRGIITTTATGTIQFQWAQGNANGNTTTLKAGSYMKIIRVK